MKKTEEMLYNACDFIIAILLLIATSPLLVLGAALVKIDRTGSVFYIQKRLTKDRAHFFMYKFRTMKENIEQGKPVWGSESDVRSSRIGNFLRCTHLDEFPQLINVLKGEMSIVGPRPERPYFAREFENTISGYSERYKVKAGITGWAQINGFRGDSSMLDRIAFDTFYIQNRSLWFNLRILLLTPFSKPVRRLDASIGEKASYIFELPHYNKNELKKKLVEIPIQRA